jgi:hypothetical protein
MLKIAASDEPAFQQLYPAVTHTYHTSSGDLILPPQSPTSCASTTRNTHRQTKTSSNFCLVCVAMKQ